MSADHIDVSRQAGNQAGQASYLVTYNRDLLFTGSSFHPLTSEAFSRLEGECSPPCFVGHLNAGPCYAAEARALPDGWQRLNLRALLNDDREGLFGLASRAVQLLDWRRNHIYCGRCGSATRADDHVFVCSQCDLHYYPRIAPSIIVLVIRGSEVLLARNPAWPAGLYSTLAGFVEPGESVEQTVHREVLEEVGVKVTNLRYLNSQSWPFPHSLMIGFHADYAGGELRLQEEEIADARWFTRQALPAIPPVGSISRWLIDAWSEETR